MPMLTTSLGLLPAYPNCGTPAFLYTLLVWIIILVGIVMIIRILLPWLGGFLGGPWSQVLQIVGWMITAVLALKLVFLLLSCAL